MGDIIQLVHKHLNDIAAGWAIGGNGAVAEFSRDAGEPAELALSEHGGVVTTARGAIRIALPPGATARPYETSGEHEVPVKVVGITLTDDDGFGAGVLTELGPDRDAIRPEDRDAILFDLGVGIPHISFCARTRDATLIAALRAQAGKPVWPAAGAIIAASPHRISRSGAGRIEVFQPIPTGPDAATPLGPHTHLLPNLLGKPGPRHAIEIYPAYSTS
jgi:hypothetical protein